MEHRTDSEPVLPFENERDATRRSFLQLVGFGLASSTFTSCSRGPSRHVVPALVGSPEFVPGSHYRIATTCGGCEAGCGTLVKCRDGRPLKLEGLPGHPISNGGLCPSGQASILSLYDSHRFHGPKSAGSSTSWSEVDRSLIELFEATRASMGRVRLLTGSIDGPSTRAAIEQFLGGFHEAQHVSYDPLSASSISEAHERTHARHAVPRYFFDRARTIVAFDADFLSTWVSPVEFTAGYVAARVPDAEPPRMSRHIHFEARTSLTGCRADERILLAPRELGSTLAGLCDAIERRAGVPARCRGAAEASGRSELLERIADELWETRGAALVVAGANDIEIQVLVNWLNHLLGNYGVTLDIASPSQQRLGSDRAVAKLAAELEADEVDVLIVQGVNPAYDFGGQLPIERARVVIACAAAPDETTELATWICPEPHYLESWSDGEPYVGTYVVRQPTVPVLRSGRTLRESLARWSGDRRSDRELVRATWRARLFSRSPETDFDRFFDSVLHDGYFVPESRASAPIEFLSDAVQVPATEPASSASVLALVLYPKAGMLDGRNAHNPWLHELPDPVTKITWDNYACLSLATAERLGLEEGDHVRVAADEVAIELPVHLQRGQHPDVVAIALGYGRVGTDRFAGVGPAWLEDRPTLAVGATVGVSAAALIDMPGGTRRFAGRSVTVTPIDGSTELAATQDHHSLELPEHLAIEGHAVRDVVLSTTLARWKADPDSVVHHHPGADRNLWEQDHRPERSWGMTIDLARCTGCSACVIGCQAENNVPVVGRDEVRRHREMSWLRIDRYFQGTDEDLRTLHQPMLCQHCDHAPCEAVCPVLATVHSSEGLNQQVYNRCVGTRYCANTCPYKVRRFNWFDYPREDELQNHSLNPNVTVRTRGVMEKCSFCVQRIQEAKGVAAREGREVRDGDVQPACQESCPAQAIQFGDLLDPESRVARSAKTLRAYSVLEELNVRPSVRYLAHVENRTNAEVGRNEH